MTPIIHLEGLTKRYRVGPDTIPALVDVSCEVFPGEFVAISGPSGSGKSTLLNLLGLLDRADTGRYLLDGRDVAAAGDDELTLLRNRKLGFVFQNSPMLPRLTAMENVAVPLVYRGESPRAAAAEAERQLARVGLGAVAGHRPGQLSGGQLQRVALARALVGRPKLVLADEPTASLDLATAGEMMALLIDLNRAAGTALVLITHDPEDAARADRQLVLEAGRLRAGPVPAAR
ncbi:MAG: ABC transporter ATP-binding protein [Opitutaceae bacterium]|nr:ABC transporter ATP-binding protein [Opitutaceae bacterium]